MTITERIALLEWIKRNGEANREDILELYTLKDEVEGFIEESWGGKTYSRPFALYAVKT